MLAFLILNWLSFEYAKFESLHACEGYMGERVCYWCYRNTQSNSCTFVQCPPALFLLRWSTCEQAKLLGTLNNACNQPLALIAVTNLLCDLKTVTYLTLVFSSVKESLMTLHQAKDFQWRCFMVTCKPLKN